MKCNAVSSLYCTMEENALSFDVEEKIYVICQLGNYGMVHPV